MSDIKNYFKFVLFEFKTGKIIRELESADDNVLFDVNGTDTIDLTVSMNTLKAAERNDSKNFFKRWQRGVALMRTNEAGKLASCVTAGVIIKSDYNSVDEQMDIQAVGIAEYFKTIPVNWINAPIKGKEDAVDNITDDFSGSAATIYEQILAKMRSTKPAAVVIPNAEVVSISAGSDRDNTIAPTIVKFPVADATSVWTAIETIRDDTFTSKSRELKFLPTYQSGSERIIWVGTMPKFSKEGTQFNIKLPPLEVSLKETPQFDNTLEVVNWEISEDALDIYNYLIVNSTDNENVFIKAKSAQKANEITLMQSVDFDTELTDAQMDEQLDSRLRGAMNADIEATLTFAGGGKNGVISILDSAAESSLANEWLGRRIKVIAGKRTSGTGITLRCVEIEFSTHTFDTEFKLNLLTEERSYPALPAQRKIPGAKKEIKETKTRDSKAKAKRKAKALKTKKNGSGSGGAEIDMQPIEWQPGGSGPGTNTPNEPEPKPSVAPGVPSMEDATETLFTTSVNPISSKSPLVSEGIDGVMALSSNGYSDQDGNLCFASPSVWTITGDVSSVTIPNPNAGYAIPSKERIFERDAFWIKKYKVANNSSNNEVSGLIDGIEKRVYCLLDSSWISSNILSRIPLNTEASVPVVDPIDYANYKYTFSEYKTVTEVSHHYKTVHIMKIEGRYYFHYLISSGKKTWIPTLEGVSTAQGFQGGLIINELFFTATVNESTGEVSNYEKLLSPSEQLFNKDGKHYSIMTSGVFNDSKISGTYGRRDDWNLSSNKNISAYNSIDKKYIFPYTSQFSSIFAVYAPPGQGAENEDGTGSPFYSPASPEDIEETLSRFSMTMDMYKHKFGLLEGDFSSKQPIWKESDIGFPIPKVDSNGRYDSTQSLQIDGYGGKVIYLDGGKKTIWNQFFNIDGPNHNMEWRKVNNFQPLKNYSYICQATNDGLYFMPHFAMSPSQMMNYFNIDVNNQAALADFNKKYTDKAFFLKKGETEWKSFSLKLGWKYNTTEALWGSPTSDSILTRINNRGDYDSNTGASAISGAGKRVSIIGFNSKGWEELWKGNSHQTYSLNYNGFTQYGPSIASIAYTPQKAEPDEVFDGIISTKKSSNWIFNSVNGSKLRAIGIVAGDDENTLNNNLLEYNRSVQFANQSSLAGNATPILAEKIDLVVKSGVSYAWEHGGNYYGGTLFVDTEGSLWQIGHDIQPTMEGDVPTWAFRSEKRKIMTGYNFSHVSANTMALGVPPRIIGVLSDNAINGSNKNKVAYWGYTNANGEQINAIGGFVSTPFIGAGSLTGKEVKSAYFFGNGIFAIDDSMNTHTNAAFTGGGGTGVTFARCSDIPANQAMASACDGRIVEFATSSRIPSNGTNVTASGNYFAFRNSNGDVHTQSGSTFKKMNQAKKSISIGTSFTGNTYSVGDDFKLYRQQFSTNTESIINYNYDDIKVTSVWNNKFYLGFDEGSKFFAPALFIAKLKKTIIESTAVIVLPVDSASKEVYHVTIMGLEIFAPSIVPPDDTEADEEGSETDIDTGKTPPIDIFNDIIIPPNAPDGEGGAANEDAEPLPPALPAEWDTESTTPSFPE